MDGAIRAYSSADDVSGFGGIVGSGVGCGPWVGVGVRVAVPPCDRSAAGGSGSEGIVVALGGRVRLIVTCGSGFVPDDATGVAGSPALVQPVIVIAAATQQKSSLVSVANRLGTGLDLLWCVFRFVDRVDRAAPGVRRSRRLRRCRPRGVRQRRESRYGFPLAVKWSDPRMCSTCPAVFVAFPASRGTVPSQTTGMHPPRVNVSHPTARWAGLATAVIAPAFRQIPIVDTTGVFVARGDGGE